VGKVLVSSRAIDASAVKIAKGSESQTLIAQKTSVKMDNGLIVMDEMVARSAQTVSKIGEARDKTRKGADNARETLAYLETVLEQMVDYSRPIYSLANKVEKIRLVMNVIDEIAQKTDLLSLNASIEATRASELGKGTVVNVFFPQIYHGSPSSLKPVKLSPSTGKKHILFIDDEVIIKILADKMFYLMGYSPVCFTDPAEALAHYRQNPDTYKIVIADYLMPELKGDDLLAEVKKADPGCITVLITGFSQDIKELRINPFIDGVILKPLIPDQMAQTLNTLLKNNRQTKA